MISRPNFRTWGSTLVRILSFILFIQWELRIIIVTNQNRGLLSCGHHHDFPPKFSYLRFNTGQNLGDIWRGWSPVFTGSRSTRYNIKIKDFNKRLTAQQGGGDKTINYKSMFTFNYDQQNYPFCSIKLLVDKFGYSRFVKPNKDPIKSKSKFEITLPPCLNITEML